MGAEFTDDWRVRAIDVLESGDPVSGREPHRLEATVAAACDADHGIAVLNRSTALLTAFHVLGVGEGDRVLANPFSFVGGPSAVAACGATPVFADVHPATLNLDPNSVEHLLRHGTGEFTAILTPHLYGRPADAAHLRELADEYDLSLVEDVGPSLGATLDGARVGSFGDAAAVSCFPADGTRSSAAGMVVTDRDDVAERARRFANLGREAGGTYTAVGHDLALTNLAAAIARRFVATLPERIEVRRSNAHRVTARLQERAVRTPIEPPNGRHVYAGYPIRTDDGEELARRLADSDVSVPVSSPCYLPREPAYRDCLAFTTVAERLSKRVVSFPVNAPMTVEGIETIAGVIDEYG